MALGAMAKYENLDVKIVPVGLNYFHAHRFRSRAVIEFGNPITVSDELVQKFKSGGTEKREACSSLLDSIYNALKTVTINAGSYETLMVSEKLYIYQENTDQDPPAIVDSSSKKIIQTCTQKIAFVPSSRFKQTIFDWIQCIQR